MWMRINASRLGRNPRTLYVTYCVLCYAITGHVLRPQLILRLQTCLFILL